LPSRRPTTASILAGLALVAVGLFTTACSGGSTSAETAPEASITAAPTTAPEATAAPTTTTSTTTTSTTTTVATTTTAPPVPVAQFTGIEVAEELTHPAIVLKMDNHQRARPQRGINQADVVFEELVEGNITRFAAVYHSQEVEPVGPVRSARTGDFDLLENLNTPIFVNSGGNPTVLDLLQAVDMVLVSDANVGRPTFYRGGGKEAPHNLLTSIGAAREAAGDRGGTPPQLFTYRAPGDELSADAEDVAIVRIDYGGYRVDFQWDAELQGWARTQQGSAHVDSDGVRIAFENVIVQFATYGTSVAFAGSPEVRVVGTGDAWILTDGKMIRATWARPTVEAVTEYRDSNGDLVALTPGRTWVALPRPGTGFLVDG